MKKLFKKILRFGLVTVGITTKIFPQSLLISVGTELAGLIINRIAKYAQSKSPKAKKATDKITDIALIASEHLAKNSNSSFDDRLIQSIRKKIK